MIFSPLGIISVNSRRTPFTASGENEILDLEGELYLGGLPDNRVGLVLPTELWTAMLNYGYVGCVRDLFIDGRSKDIRQIAQSQNMTGIKSSCSKVTGKQCDSSPCKNNGACKEGWNRFICDCTGTGFWDSTCERGELSLQLSLPVCSVCFLSFSDHFKNAAVFVRRLIDLFVKDLLKSARQLWSPYVPRSPFGPCGYGMECCVTPS